MIAQESALCLPRGSHGLAEPATPGRSAPFINRVIGATSLQLRATRVRVFITEEVEERLMNLIC